MLLLRNITTGSRCFLRNNSEKSKIYVMRYYDTKKERAKACISAE